MSDFLEASQNPRIFERWCFLADKIARHPELLEIPLRDIARWIADDRFGNRQPLEDWRGMIVSAQQTPAGMEALPTLLRDDD